MGRGEGLLMNTSQPNQNVIDIKTLPHLLDIKAAVALGVGTERTIRRMCERGELKAVKAGRQWRINRDALLEQMGLA